MLSPHKLLVVDFNADNGVLLHRTLTRKFPSAIVQICSDKATAIATTATEQIDAIVLHRTEDDDAVKLVRMLRKINATAPIIVVSGTDRSEEVLAAGATGFLNMDQWLMIGSVVANALNAERDVPASSRPFPPGKTNRR